MSYLKYGCQRAPASAGRGVQRELAGSNSDTHFTSHQGTNQLVSPSQTNSFLLIRTSHTKPRENPRSGGSDMQSPASGRELGP